MEEKINLQSFFSDYVKRESIFKNKKILQSNYIPDEIPHRNSEVSYIANILAPCLKGEKPSNLFIYGKTGTGKTCVVKHVVSEIDEVLKKNQKKTKFFYLNCKLKRISDTEYRLIAQVCRELGKDIPITGLPTEEVYNSFHKVIEDEKCNVVLILDEIDELVMKIGDGILYTLTRINSELKNSQLSIIGISNNVVFIESLDPRVRSSLSEEELLFPTYNALQLQDILKKRCNLAIRDGCVEQGLIEKCAAFAAREHGDARRAIELLRVSAEIADRRNCDQIMVIHLDEAEDKIERERIVEIIKSQPRQHQLVLFSILSLNTTNQKNIFTGEAYELYLRLCAKVNLRPLTQRRVSDVISELDMLGVVNAKVISKGRYGRTRDIKINLTNQLTSEIKHLLESVLDVDYSEISFLKRDS